MAESKVFWNAGDDPEMSAASRRARETFRYFWREKYWESRRIVPALSIAAVKAQFEDPALPEPNVEHMWLDDLEFDGEVVAGNLVNEPNWLRLLSAGERVAVPLTDISDWMYAHAGAPVCGAFTVHLMRSRMPAHERAEHDAAWGLDFGGPNQLRLVPDWTALAPRKGFFRRLFGTRPADPDDEHPMSVSMRPALAEALASDPSLLTFADENGQTWLHHHAMAGSTDGVEVLLAGGADRHAVDANGRTARDLADRVGWPRVVALLSA